MFAADRSVEVVAAGPVVVAAQESLSVVAGSVVEQLVVGAVVAEVGVAPEIVVVPKKSQQSSSTRGPSDNDTDRRQSGLHCSPSYFFLPPT